MRKINFEDPKITLRITPTLKRRAAEIAEARGLSVSQLVEDLIRNAESHLITAEIVRGIVQDELKNRR
jgi:predicted HicB family RNase H-like nuclease